jgi:ATP-dependent DNA helicase RecG
MNILDTPIEYLKGIGPSKAELLKKELGIFTFKQLLEHYPFRYVDRTKFHRVRELSEVGEEDYVQIRGILRRVETQGEGRKRRIVGTFVDETGTVEIVWFQGLHWIEQLAIGIEYIAFGKPSRFKDKISLVHPDLEAVTANNTQTASSFEPIYPTTEKLKAKGLDSKGLSKILRQALLRLHEQKNQLLETLPPYLIEKLRFCDRLSALTHIHFPSSSAELQQAKRRLKFEEFFFMQLRMLYSKHSRKLGTPGLVFEKIGPLFNQFYETGLRFDLTGAQKRVLKEIRRDLGSGVQMNRLLQGDVGSGKTVVGFMTMLMGLDNGYQACLMAPTEILAQQHYQSVAEMAASLGLRVELLTGSTKGKARKAILQDLAEGKIPILIGTHALIEEKVVFQNLGIAIIDEQHRFGVVQRAKMWRKNEQAPPHVLVMTATPIPRTLAMTVYGDLDVSVIDEMPPGRKPIQTFHKYESQRLWTFGLMRREIEQGRQVYVVYPLIEESAHESMEDLKNLMEGVEAIERDFPKPRYQISVVHGRQKPEDKEYEMQRFIKGETQIMVATTVIEVGVNVPNATVMVIENAERFGLAQLHQLRGRVGRGGGDSYCILMTSFKLSNDSRFRMQIMTETTDGFKISEADLKLRGPGSLEGTQQSGIVQFKIADIVKDQEILRGARLLVENILEEDPKLEQEKNALLKQYIWDQARGQGFAKIS